MSREAAKDNSPGLQAWEPETRAICPEGAQEMRIHRSIGYHSETSGQQYVRSPLAGDFHTLPNPGLTPGFSSGLTSLTATR
jgi:hypothetical protein